MHLNHQGMQDSKTDHHAHKRKQCIQGEREIRENLTERQIDKMIEDSFPASDPPSTY